MDDIIEKFDLTRQQRFIALLVGEVGLILGVFMALGILCFVVVKMRNINIGKLLAALFRKAPVSSTAVMPQIMEPLRRIIAEHDGSNHKQAAELREAIAALTKLENENHAATMSRLAEMQKSLATLAKK